ncbi:MAG: hypothetical protein HY716_17555 [Planctomycetes bacterium]|nr:hypothetical protein [Planctomycetota bacterium]
MTPWHEAGGLIETCDNASALEATWKARRETAQLRNLTAAALAVAAVMAILVAIVGGPEEGAIHARVRHASTHLVP